MILDLSFQDLKQIALVGRVEKNGITCDFLLAQDLRKMKHLLRVRRLGCTPASLKI